MSMAQIPLGYYDGTEGLTGYALKSKIHEIISKKTYCYNYEDLIDFYNSTDLDTYYDHGIGNTTLLLDIYSERPLGADAYEYTAAQNVGNVTAEGQGYNREHGMPQSTFYGAYPMYSDLNYVIPADAYINQRRSNFPYARNNGENITFSNGSKLGKSTTPGYSNVVYEPIDEFKGDVARYLLYFVVRYEGSLNTMDYQVSTSPLDGSEERGFETWYIDMLKDWAALDPVSQREIDRNNTVYAIQKTRNPFIDHPEWISIIWSETADSIAPSAPTNLSASVIAESFVNLTWAPSPDSDVLGYKIYQNGNYIGYTKSNSFYADRLSAASNYSFTVKAYDKGFLLSADSNVYNITTLLSDDLAKDLMITKYIEGTTSTANQIYNNAIEISNKTGHPVNLNNYYLNTQFKSSTGFYFSEAFQLEGVISANTSIVVVHPKSSFSNYSINQAEFITNSSPLAYSGSQYVELSYGTKYLKTISTNNYEMAYAPIDVVGVKDIFNDNANVSLYRNSNVTDPNTTFTISEWTSYPINYATGLGDDIALSTDENLKSHIMIYPNPTSNILYVSGKNYHKIQKAEIYDLTGKLIIVINHPFKNTDNIGVSMLNAGNYLLKLDDKTIRFIKK